MRRGVACVVLVAMLVVIGVGLDRTRASVDRLSDHQLRQVKDSQSARYRCLEQSLRAQIPPGATVVNRATHTLDKQRITEELTPGYRIVGTPHTGDYLVTFAGHGACGGQSAVVTRAP